MVNIVKMSHSEKDPLPPSYSESQGLGSSRIHSSSSTSITNRGQSLLDQVTLTRATQIKSIIETAVLPLVEEQASYGIAQTTIALLPSDIPLPVVEEKSEFSFSNDTSKAIEIIGFTSELEPKIVRLEGHMNRTEFWRVQAVVTDLERVLRESLNASPVLRSPTSPTRERRFDSWPTGEQMSTRRNLLSRVIPSLGPEQRSPGVNPEVGLRKAVDGNEVGLVLVKARLEEICLRTVNEFGLYDTMNKQCIIVRVDARC